MTLELSLEAGEVLDAGLQLFCPSVAQRRARMINLMANGGVAEVNFTWPCKVGCAPRCGQCVVCWIGLTKSRAGTVPGPG